MRFGLGDQESIHGWKTTIKIRGGLGRIRISEINYCMKESGWVQLGIRKASEHGQQNELSLFQNGDTFLNTYYLTRCLSLCPESWKHILLSFL